MIAAVVDSVLPLIVVFKEFGCSGGFTVNLCGLETVLITFPAQLLFGKMMQEQAGEINFSHQYPMTEDLVLLCLYVGTCAALRIENKTISPTGCRQVRFTR
ncbi:MAG: hypothetical protein HY231_18585 [Acidobacteria bacterium]|nr:hypothetical protein [Acidobacteriota bacterium]